MERKLDFTALDKLAYNTARSDFEELVRLDNDIHTQEPLKPATELTEGLQSECNIEIEKQLETAQKIIKDEILNKEIAKGCMTQILQDIERKENPYKLLLYAAESIGRLSWVGDNFFLEVQQKLIDVYGYDISEREIELKQNVS